MRLPEVVRHRREVDEVGEHHRGDEHGEQHRGGARAVDQHLQQHAPREGAAGEREEEGARCADARALGGREDAAVDAAQHHDDEQGDAPDAAQRGPALGPAGALAGGPGGWIAPGDPGDADHQQGRAQQAGQHAGGEELADVRLGDDAVDHHDGGRRNHDAERAAGGDDAGGEVVGVAVALHRRVGDAAHRGSGGDGRAADGSEARAGDDRGVRQAAAHMADEAVGGAEQLVREPGAGDEVAHQDEQRHDAQRVGEAGLEDHLRGAGEAGRPASQQAEADHAHQAHREGQRHAQRRKREDGEEAEQRLGHVNVRIRLRRSAARAPRGAATGGAWGPTIRGSAGPQQEPLRGAATRGAWGLSFHPPGWWCATGVNISRTCTSAVTVHSAAMP